MGAEHQIHMTEGFANFFRHVGLLHGAATEADDLVGLTALGVGQGAHVAQHPQLCVLPDGTGVDDDDIRHAGILGEGVAHLPKHPSNLFAVRLVLLAAISVHQRQGLPPCLGIVLCQLAADLHLTLNLPCGDQNFLTLHSLCFLPNSVRHFLGAGRHVSNRCVVIQYTISPLEIQGKAPLPALVSSCQKCQSGL